MRVPDIASKLLPRQCKYFRMERAFVKAPAPTTRRRCSHLHDVRRIGVQYAVKRSEKSYEPQSRCRTSVRKSPKLTDSSPFSDKRQSHNSKSRCDQVICLRAHMINRPCQKRHDHHIQRRNKRIFTRGRVFQPIRLKIITDKIETIRQVAHLNFTIDIPRICFRKSRHPKAPRS